MAIGRPARPRRRLERTKLTRTAFLRAPALVAAVLLPLVGSGALEGSHAWLPSVKQDVAQVASTVATGVNGLVRNAADAADPGRRKAVHLESGAARTSARLADASPADRADVLAAAAASGPLQRPYVLKAFAAGHSADEVVRFASLIRGKKPTWLRTHLSLVDADRHSLVTYHAALVRQVDNTTCGSTAILMSRAIVDPIYALYLTTGGTDDPMAARNGPFEARLAAEEERIHDSTNSLWPKKFGTTPSGVSAELNRNAKTLGTRYQARLVEHGRSQPLRDAVAAARYSQPVPVLIGDWLPRHYVLLIGASRGDLLFYEPTAATLVRLDVQDFLAGKVKALGFPHVQAVITPSR
ncbi:hypothetical protein AB0L70_34940 [Kribbella sp. NPDC051952]|uniref:hypothetical protein n=1 Tax=Kribbella sp. NPDC051952 TaxID=3154851 RepID=UPI003445C563